MHLHGQSKFSSNGVARSSSLRSHKVLYSNVPTVAPHKRRLHVSTSEGLVEPALVIPPYLASSSTKARTPSLCTLALKCTYRLTVRCTSPAVSGSNIYAVELSGKNAIAQPRHRVIVFTLQYTQNTHARASERRKNTAASLDGV